MRSTHLLDSDEAIASLLRDSRRIAVVGIKPESLSGQPAHYVPEYLQRAGYDVIPVPVYYPEISEILRQPVYRCLAQIPGAVDLVVMFRRPGDLPAHLADLLACRPRAVWFQSGIRNDNVAQELAAASMDVVQDRCTMVEHRRLIAGRQ